MNTCGIFAIKVALGDICSYADIKFWPAATRQPNGLAHLVRVGYRRKEAKKQETSTCVKWSGECRAGPSEMHFATHPGQLPAGGGGEDRQAFTSPVSFLTPFVEKKMMTSETRWWW